MYKGTIPQKYLERMTNVLYYVIAVIVGLILGLGLTFIIKNRKILSIITSAVVICVNIMMFIYIFNEMLILHVAGVFLGAVIVGVAVVDVYNIIAHRGDKNVEGQSENSDDTNGNIE